VNVGAVAKPTNRRSDQGGINMGREVFDDDFRLSVVHLDMHDTIDTVQCAGDVGGTAATANARYGQRGDVNCGRVYQVLVHAFSTQRSALDYTFCPPIALAKQQTHSAAFTISCR
jgi:hypothetical protein